MSLVCTNMHRISASEFRVMWQSDVFSDITATLAYWSQHVLEDLANLLTLSRWRGDITQECGRKGGKETCPSCI